MTFVGLRQDVYRDTGFSDSPAAAIVTRVGGWLNKAQRTLLRDPRLTDLRQGTLPITSVIGVSQYAIPQAMERIDAIVQQTNDRRLRFMSRDLYRQMDPAERSTGTPDCWVPEGVRPVFTLPSVVNSAGTGLWVASSSAGDTTQKAHITGIRANGDQVAQQEVTLTGTTVAQLGTFTDIVIVTEFTVSATCAGAISLYADNGKVNVLARVPIGRTSVQYQVIRLWPTPAEVLTYLIDGQFDIVDMVKDDDIPMLPESFHDLLAEYARMKEYERTGEKRFAIAAQNWATGMALLRNYVEFPPDYFPVAGSMTTGLRRNNLGPWFPPDWSWP